MTFEELEQRALQTLHPRRLARHAEAGQVSAALLTNLGNVYTGLCIDTPCDLGCCAEAAAVATMVTAGESHVVKMVALYQDGSILPPCGRCRELISQIHDNNGDCEVLLPGHRVALLRDFLPEMWDHRSWNSDS